MIPAPRRGLGLDGPLDRPGLTALTDVDSAASRRL